MGAVRQTGGQSRCITQLLREFFRLIFQSELKRFFFPNDQVGWNVVGRLSVFRRAYLHIFDAAVPLSSVDEEAEEKGDRRPEYQR